MKPRSFWDRKIPSLFGIIVLIAGVLLAGWMAQTGIIFTGRAAPGNTPTNTTVSNITDHSFTVSYITTDAVLGTVTYGENSSDTATALDDRDQKSGRSTPHKVHSITMQNVKAGTQYIYSINSGGGSFTNNGHPFTITTAKKIAGTPPQNNIIKGKVVSAQGSPAEALVYLSSSNSQVLSTITKSDGTYTIATKSLQNKDLASYIVVSPITKLAVSVVSPEGTSSISVLARNTNPLPVITLSNIYDFATETDSKSRIASESAEITGFPDAQNNTKSGTPTRVTISTPTDGQVLSDQRPTLKGTAPPSTEVEITIDLDEPIQANVISDKRGNWTYRPKSPITPGEGTITANARDSSGIVKSATQSFTILAPGSQFTDPSVSPIKNTPTPTKKQATPTPTKSGPTGKATPTGAITNTPTPTTPQATPTEIVISITPSVAITAPATIAPTNAIPTGQVVTSVTPVPSIAPTGNNDVILYSLIGAIAITIGAVLLFLTGGMSL